MIFQSLDDKNNCQALYYDSSLRQEFAQHLSATWDYKLHHPDSNIDYANIYCGGMSLDDVCPEHLQEKWNDVVSKLKAFLVSFRESKVDLSQLCFYDLVPDKFLIQYCHIKSEITKSVFQNFLRPKNYRFLLDVYKLAEKIKFQKLNLDLSELNIADKSARIFKNKIGKYDPYIRYNIFGTKTGRLTTVNNSFPVLTFDKNHRSILKPNNDCFLELDFNGAELRTLLALSGKQQPTEDIHDWNIKNVYNNSVSREEAKKKTFAWLYNPSSHSGPLSAAYDRDAVVESHFNGSQVSTFFDRKIAADSHHALNYIIQSTTSDLLLRRMVAIDKILATRQSFVSFSLHDSVIIDYSLSDKELFNDIIKCFQQTELGVYKCNISIGRDFGNMKNIESKKRSTDGNSNWPR